MNLQQDKDGLNHSTTQLLLVDDDADFCDTVQQYLQHQGFAVACVGDGPALESYLAEHSIDLLILDILLPGEDGISLARRLRSQNQWLPILMLSSCTDETDRVVGLEVGADDYLTKPVGLRELLARVRALLRRAQRPADTASSAEPCKDVYSFAPFRLCRATHRLFRGDTEVPLTATEFRILCLFCDRPNQVLNRDRLLLLLKGYEHAPSDRSIDVSVSRLRAKLEVDVLQPRYIRTVRGEGYMFCPHPQQLNR